jgi:hypothetical protein
MLQGVVLFFLGLGQQKGHHLRLNLGSNLKGRLFMSRP